MRILLSLLILFNSIVSAYALPRRDLILTSMQNLNVVDANSYNFGVSVSNGLPGFSFGMGQTTANRRYTDTPTTIIADEKLDVVVNRNTLLAGAGMWSKTV